MSMKNKVSVIIPVHNNEKYIERCVYSVLNQTYQDIQVIVVDDGSTDNTSNILKKINDTRLIVKSIENKGVSGARNYGMKFADGQFVTFADADDWLPSNAIETLVGIVNNGGFEFIIANYSRKNVFDKYYVEPRQVSKKIKLQEAYKKVINPFGFYGSVWAKLFSIDIIKDNNLTFNEDIAVGEDLLFVYQYLGETKKIGYTESIVYNYFVNDNSVLNTLNEHSYKKRMDILKVYEYILSRMDIENPIYLRANSIFTRELASWYCYSVHYHEKNLSRKLKEKLRERLVMFLKDNTFSYKTKCATLCKFFLPRIMFYVVN